MTNQTTQTTPIKRCGSGKPFIASPAFFREKRTWAGRWSSWQSGALCQKSCRLPEVSNNNRPRGLPYACAAMDSPIRYSCRVHLRSHFAARGMDSDMVGR